MSAAYVQCQTRLNVQDDFGMNGMPCTKCLVLGLGQCYWGRTRGRSSVHIQVHWFWVCRTDTTELKQQQKLKPLPIKKLRCDIQTSWNTCKHKTTQCFLQRTKRTEAKGPNLLYFLHYLCTRERIEWEFLNGMRAVVQIYMTSELCRDFGV